MATPLNLQNAVLNALRQWHTPTPETPLGDLFLIQRAHQATPHAAANELLQALLTRLTGQASQQADFLRLRFIDGMEQQRMMNRLNISEPTFFRRQKDAVKLLTEILRVDEEAAVNGWRTRMEARLELPTYENLFGVDKLAEELLRLLLQEDAPWLILLKGIGGIGKTTLADHLARQLTRTSTRWDVAWVTARQQHFRLGGDIALRPELSSESLLEGLAVQILGRDLPSPFATEQVLTMLTARLLQQPHLIVVDNLETVADVEQLLPLLRRLAKPSKLLLTSRHELDDPFVYPYTVPPLAQEDALALVRYEAQGRNLPLLVEATDAQLLPIFETVGGNPLALRLVVGQTHHHALATVLTNLKEARGVTVEHLYTYIFRRAWDLLTEEQRSLFVTLPLLPHTGAGLDFLLEISGLDAATLHNALTPLIMLSLVDHHRISLDQSRYAIHSLTRAFLLEQVIRWQQ